MCADCHTHRTGTTYICVDSNICSENCSNSTCECCSENQSCTECECGNCFGGEGESGIHTLLIIAVIVLGVLAILGMFYSVLVATMVGQRIWQRRYHILEKRILTKVSYALVFVSLSKYLPLYIGKRLKFVTLL